MMQFSIWMKLLLLKYATYEGKKTVIIRTQSQEKCRVSLVLGIIADGNKLPPLIIFKGSNKTKIPKNLYNNKNIKEDKIFIAFNDNAWCQGI